MTILPVFLLMKGHFMKLFKRYFKQKNRKTAAGIIKIIVAAAMIFFTCLPAYATQTGTIQELAAHVYQSASTESNIVANVILGYSFPILAEETDEAGNVWYLIETDMGVQGYIPAQIVVKTADNAQQGESAGEGNAQAQEPDRVMENGNENEDESGLPDSVKKQLLTTEVVNIRDNPSTDGEIVGKIPQGTTLNYTDAITNQTGEVWYEVTYGDARGFIRQSTVMELEAAGAAQDDALTYAPVMSAENIDIDKMMETARLYRNESQTGENSSEPADTEESPAQEQTIYDKDFPAGENTAEGAKRRHSLHPDMVVVVSLLGILMCGAVMARTIKRLSALYRQRLKG